MKLLLSFFFVLSAALSHPLYSEIIETQNFCQIANYITPSTLVILDIDDTLLIPKQTLGTDVWFSDRLKYLRSKKQDKQETFKQALREWEAIRKITEIELVESETDQIIYNLQARKIPVMGLTTQGLAMSVVTPQQLLSLNIDLKKSAPSDEDFFFISERGILYIQGILFTDGTSKGKALVSFLKRINLSPPHILFINDKYSHLKDVQKALKETNIKYTGLRYGYGDARAASYSRDVADIQMRMSNFERIISDEEAKEILEKQQEALAL